MIGTIELHVQVREVDLSVLKTNTWRRGLGSVQRRYGLVHKEAMVVEDEIGLSRRCGMCCVVSIYRIDPNAWVKAHAQQIPLIHDTGVPC